MSDDKKEQPLVGWDEIAKHLGVSVVHAKGCLARLPSPPPTEKIGHYVFAYPSKLDAWKAAPKTGVVAVELRINPATGRPVKVVKHDGIEATVAEHAARLGLSYGAFHLRLMRSRPATRPGGRKKKDQDQNSDRS